MKPKVSQYLSRQELRALVQRARLEDLGEAGRDLTSECAIASERQGYAVIVARAAGRLAGAALLSPIASVYDGDIEVGTEQWDGDRLNPGDVIAIVRGPLPSLLAFERVALNFLTHLSGIATLTAEYVAQTAGTKARICDTRKTLPGLRAVQKYAVACGGGVNHRMGLHDAVLIKDNHLAGVADAALKDAVTQAITRARAATPPPAFVEVEVDRLGQLRHVLAAHPDMVLLDNMAPDVLREAVALRDAEAPGVLLEASGGVNLKTVRSIAETGVDRISVGALTHSAPALDIAMDIR